MFHHKLTVLFALLVLSPSLPAQEKNAEGKVVPSHEYRNAIGIRAGKTSGVTFKHFLNSGNAVELLAAFWRNALGFTALYEKHQSTGLRGLKFYYGAGAHFTGETGSYYYRRHGDRPGEYAYRYGPHGFAVGIDGLVGIDYKIGVIPLAISLDLKPFVEVSNYGLIYNELDVGLGIKLAF